MYRNVSEALPHLLDDLLYRDEVGSRGGERVREKINATVALQCPWEREILNPGRKANLAAQIAETMWVLSGRDDLAWLRRYLPRVDQFSDDGGISWRGAYGPRIRTWGEREIDQLAHVVDLLRADPTTRRAVIQIYDPDVDTDPGKDIPCTQQIQFLSRLGYLHCRVVMRSNDVWWGWSGINTFEWSALQEIVAGMLGVKIGTLTFSTGSLHLYDRHWDTATRVGSEVKPTKPSPWFNWTPAMTVPELDDLLADWMDLEHLIWNDPTGVSRVVTDGIDAFPEPMFRSWLRVLRWYRTGDTTWLEPLRGTRLYYAAEMSYRPEADPLIPSRFVDYASDLHAEKDAAYGDSWKRRGEQIGILANIARKVDRLGVGGAGDTATDTAVDLLIYLAKYRWWLAARPRGTAPVTCLVMDHVSQVDTLLRSLASMEPRTDGGEATLEQHLRDDFERLEQMPDLQVKESLVNHMLALAYELASTMWWKDQNATRRWKGYE